MLGKTHAVIGAMTGVLLLPYLHIPVHHIPFTDTISNFTTQYIPQLTGSLVQGQEAIDQKVAVIIGVGAAIVGSLVPDLDHPNSKLSRDIAPIKIGSRRITFLLVAVLLWYLTGIGQIPKETGIVLSIWIAVVAFLKHRGMTHSIVGLLLSYFAISFIDSSISLAFGVGYASHIAADMVTDRGVPLLWPIKYHFHIPTGIRTGSSIEKGIRFIALCLTVLAFVSVLNGVDLSRVFTYSLRY